MASQSDVYKRQLHADRKRQPRHGLHLKELDDELGSLNRTSPYSLLPDDFRRLEQLLACGKICHGFPGSMEGPFCYHISSVWKLQNNTEKKVLRGTTLTAATEEEAFDRIADAYEESGQQWLPLRDFIGGRYSGRRRFSWWTTFDLSSGELQCNAHRMGLLNDDVALDCLVLRCRTDFIRTKNLSFVPTVIDAFFSEIFQPTQDHQSPTRGTTIDLEDPNNLKDGVPEFAVRPLEIDMADIELIPVNLKESARPAHKVYRDDVSDSLLKYYENLE